MAKTERGDDQSMEEILSSIRKIASQKSDGAIPLTEPEKSWTLDQSLVETDPQRPSFGFSRNMPSSKSILGESGPVSGAQSDELEVVSSSAKKSSTLNGGGTPAVSGDGQRDEVKSSLKVVSEAASAEAQSAEQGLAKTLNRLIKKENGTLPGNGDGERLTVSKTDDLSDLLGDPQTTYSARTEPVQGKAEPLAAKVTSETEPKQPEEPEIKIGATAKDGPKITIEKHGDAGKLSSKAAQKSDLAQGSKRTNKIGSDKNGAASGEKKNGAQESSGARGSKSESVAKTGNSDLERSSSSSNRDSFPRIARKSGGFFPPSDRAKVPLTAAKDKNDNAGGSGMLDDLLAEEVTEQTKSESNAVAKTRSKDIAGKAAAGEGARAVQDELANPIAASGASGQKPQTETSESSPLDALAAGIAASSAKLATESAANSPQVSNVAEMRAQPPSTVPAEAPNNDVEARTLEDVVTDMLRPMLHEWLETNMPRIVENALRIEASQATGSGNDRTS